MRISIRTLSILVLSTTFYARGVVWSADAPPPPSPVPSALPQSGIQVITPSTSEVMDKPKIIAPPIHFSENTVKEYLMIRDPFKEPENQLMKISQISDLEKYDTTDFKLIGVMTGPQRMRAIIRDPQNKAHTIAVNTRMGKRKGYVRKITTASVIIREVYPNAIGEEEVYDTEIPLSSRSSTGGR